MQMFPAFAKLVKYKIHLLLTTYCYVKYQTGIVAFEMLPTSVIVIKIIAWSVSLSGSIYQLYILTDAYTQYETVNDVIVTQSNPTPPPKLVICSQPEAFLNNNTKINLTKPVPSLILNSSIPPEEVLDVVFYRKFGFQQDILSNFSTSNDTIAIEIFYKRLRTCYSFDISPTVDVDRSDLHTAVNGYLTYILKEPFLNISYGWWLQLLPPGTHSYGVIESILEIEATKNDHYLTRTTISYDYIETSSMPAPYRTACYDYKKKNFESRAHAYDSCIRNAFSELGKLPSFLYTNMQDSMEVIPNYHIANNHEHLRAIQESCGTRTRWVDCEQKLYLPYFVNSRQKGRVVHIASPARPAILTKAKAQIGMWDLITYILSSLSFWFAFSPLVFLTESCVSKFVTQKIIRAKGSSRFDDIDHKLQTLSSQMKNYVTIDELVILRKVIDEKLKQY